MAGRGGFTDLGHLLILAGADTLQKTVLTAVQHPVQHLDFLNATSHTSRSGYIFGSHTEPIMLGIRLTIQPVSRKCWLGEHALFEGGGGHCRGGGVRTLLSVVR